ncbi:MAG TPA: NAD-dependent epimerase/dehydratase family protein [Desulfomonilia bacterium]|nr:NAD-dependent epimerase/dehydratase family protein [Desulfomonilia bacterium]
MKIFITGATGFIGTRMAKDLSDRGHTLICLVRKTSNIRALENIGAVPFWGDVCDRRSLKPGMSGCDALIHLAAATSFWEQDRESYSLTNVNGTRNVMECAVEAGIPRVVHMSALSVYGRPAQRPFDETSTVGPVRFSEYARTKYEAERIAWGLHAKKDLPLVVCYPAVALGAGRRAGGTSFIGRLVGALSVSRAFLNSIHTFVHVQDVAEAVSRILDREFPIGQRYFIAGERLSIRRLLAMVEETSGRKLPRSSVSIPSARIVGTTLTAVAGITRKPPLMGLSSDYLATLREGLAADGGKAVRELGMTYTPISAAVSEEVSEMDAEGLLSDKRRARRYPLGLEIAYRAQGDDGPMRGYVLNISESGMYIITRKPYPRGRYISANLSPNRPGGYFMARGRVVRATAGGIAIDFSHRDGSIRDLIEELGKYPHASAPVADAALTRAAPEA